MRERQAGRWRAWRHRPDCFWRLLDVEQKLLGIVDASAVVLGLEVGLVLPLHLGELDEELAEHGGGSDALREAPELRLAVKLPREREFERGAQIRDVDIG